MALGRIEGDSNEHWTPNVFVLSLDNTVYAWSVRTVATATVDAVMREAFKDLAQAVARTTQWFADDVRDELIFQVVPRTHSLDWKAIEEDAQSVLDKGSIISNQSLSATIHAVAKAIVNAITDEAVVGIVQATEETTEQISRAIGNEHDSQVPIPGWRIASYNAMETQAVSSESIAQSVREQQEIPAAFSGDRLSLQADTFSIDVRALAEVIAGMAVRKALHKAARGIDKARAVVPKDVSHLNTEKLSPLLNETDALPVTQRSIATDESLEANPIFHELAVLYVHEITSLALHQVMAINPLELEDYVDDNWESYTPINTPTPRDDLPKSLLSSTQALEQEEQFIPSAQSSERVTPPDTKSTSRRQSPITSNRGLRTMTHEESSPSSAPLAMRTLFSVANDAITDLTPLHPILPPIALPQVQLTDKMTHHEWQTPRKIPRQYSYPPPFNTFETQSLTKVELLSLSSTRTEEFACSHQHLSLRPRCYHDNYSKQLRDAACQTSPPSSLSLPHRPSLNVCHGSNGSNSSIQVFHSKPSPRALLLLEKSTKKKTTEGDNTQLGHRLKTPAALPSTGSRTSKVLNPSRTHRSSSGGHSRKGTGSSIKRSGYCQRCVFEGQSCKINDCLKH